MQFNVGLDKNECCQLMMEFWHHHGIVLVSFQSDDGDVFGISKVTVNRLPQSISQNVTAGTELIKITNWVNKLEHTDTST